jgi:hypothetical protein
LRLHEDPADNPTAIEDDVIVLVAEAKYLLVLASVSEAIWAE